MATRQFTIEDLRRILLEGAGEAEGVDLHGEILDVRFDDLGYESLALLETSGRIEREYGITLEDTAVTDAGTPRALIDVINANLR